MTIKTTTHLNFRGQARAALEFYRSVFGGQLAAITYADAHAVQRTEEAEQIMWGQVLSDSGFHIMAYDVPASMEWNPGTIPLFVSIRSTDAAELTALWEKLGAAATIIVPLAKAAWSPLYGMLKDQFDITWVVDLEVAHPG